MVKDEDVCLHCGLCAERCPTGAWDMQKFLLEMTHAGRGGRRCTGRRPSVPRGRPIAHQRPRDQPCGIDAINDFVVKFANVNGSGSASANELFARSILRMGVPVSARATSSRRTSRACRPGTRCASPSRATSAAAAAST